MRGQRVDRGVQGLQEGATQQGCGARAPVNSLPRGQLVHGPWGGSLGESRRPDHVSGHARKTWQLKNCVRFLIFEGEEGRTLHTWGQQTDSVLCVCTSSVIPLTLRPAQIDFIRGGIICRIFKSETRRGSLPPKSLSPWVAPPRFITRSAGRDGVIPPPSVSQPFPRFSPFPLAFLMCLVGSNPEGGVQRF